MTFPASNRIAAVIVAAGRGARAGGAIAKQWQTVAGRRIIDHTLAVFAAHPSISHIVVCLHPDALEDAPAGCLAVAGGEDRAQSVAAGLRALENVQPDYVLIHDVARPCLTDALIDRIIAALDTRPGAAPAVPVTDALWTGADGIVTGTRDRTGLFRAQTPQGFHFAAICAAHAAHPGGAADDVEVARASGLDVAIVEGDEDNIKVTHPGDFARVAHILERRNGHKAG